MEKLSRIVFVRVFPLVNKTGTLREAFDNISQTLKIAKALKHE